MHHQSVISTASQKLFCVKVIGLIVLVYPLPPQTALSCCPLVPQLVICFVSHNALWDVLGDESEFVIFSQRLAVAYQQIVNTPLLQNTFFSTKAAVQGQIIYTFLRINFSLYGNTEMSNYYYIKLYL